MKTTVVFIALLGLTAAAKLDGLQHLDGHHSNQGNQRFTIQTENFQHSEFKSEKQNDNEAAVTGSYSWTAPNGQIFTIDYIADERGFRPVIRRGEFKTTSRVTGSGGGGSSSFSASSYSRGSGSGSSTGSIRGSAFTANAGTGQGTFSSSGPSNLRPSVGSSSFSSNAGFNSGSPSLSSNAGFNSGSSSFSSNAGFNSGSTSFSSNAGSGSGSTSFSSGTESGSLGITSGSTGGSTTSTNSNQFTSNIVTESQFETPSNLYGSPETHESGISHSGLSTHHGSQGVSEISHSSSSAHQGSQGASFVSGGISQSSGIGSIRPVSDFGSGSTAGVVGGQGENIAVILSGQALPEGIIKSEAPFQVNTITTGTGISSGSLEAITGAQGPATSSGSLSSTQSFTDDSVYVNLVTSTDDESTEFSVESDELSDISEDAVAVISIEQENPTAILSSGSPVISSGIVNTVSNSGSLSSFSSQTQTGVSGDLSGSRFTTGSRPITGSTSFAANTGITGGSSGSRFTTGSRPITGSTTFGSNTGISGGSRGSGESVAVILAGQGLPAGVKRGQAPFQVTSANVGSSGSSGNVGSQGSTFSSGITSSGFGTGAGSTTGSGFITPGTVSTAEFSSINTESKFSTHSSSTGHGGGNEAAVLSGQSVPSSGSFIGTVNQDSVLVSNVEGPTTSNTGSTFTNTGFTPSVASSPGVNANVVADIGVTDISNSNGGFSSVTTGSKTTVISSSVSSGSDVSTGSTGTFSGSQVSSGPITSSRGQGESVAVVLAGQEIQAGVKRGQAQFQVTGSSSEGSRNQGTSTGFGTQGVFGSTTGFTATSGAGIGSGILDSNTRFSSGITESQKTTVSSNAGISSGRPGVSTGSSGSRFSVGGTSTSSATGQQGESVSVILAGQGIPSGVTRGQSPFQVTGASIRGSSSSGNVGNTNTGAGAGSISGSTTGFTATSGTGITAGTGVGSGVRGSNTRFSSGIVESQKNAVSPSVGTLSGRPGVSTGTSGSRFSVGDTSTSSAAGQQGESVSVILAGQGIPSGVTRGQAPFQVPSTNIRGSGSSGNVGNQGSRVSSVTGSNFGSTTGTSFTGTTTGSRIVGTSQIAGGRISSTSEGSRQTTTGTRFTGTTTGSRVGSGAQITGGRISSTSGGSRQTFVSSNVNSGSTFSAGTPRPSRPSIGISTNSGSSGSTTTGQGESVAVILSGQSLPSGVRRGQAPFQITSTLIRDSGSTGSRGTSSSSLETGTINSGISSADSGSSRINGFSSNEASFGSGERLNSNQISGFGSSVNNNAGTISSGVNSVVTTGTKFQTVTNTKPTIAVGPSRIINPVGALITPSDSASKLQSGFSSSSSSSGQSGESVSVILGGQGVSAGIRREQTTSQVGGVGFGGNLSNRGSTSVGTGSTSQFGGSRVTTGTSTSSFSSGSRFSSGTSNTIGNSATRSSITGTGNSLGARFTSTGVRPSGAGRPSGTSVTSSRRFISRGNNRGNIPDVESVAVLLAKPGQL